MTNNNLIGKARKRMEVYMSVPNCIRSQRNVDKLGLN